MRGRAAERPSKKRGGGKPWMARRNPAEHDSDVLSGAAGREPARRVTRRRPVSSRVERVRGDSSRLQGLEHRSFEAGHMQIEIRAAAPCAAVQEENGPAG